MRILWKVEWVCQTRSGDADFWQRGGRRPGIRPEGTRAPGPREKGRTSWLAAWVPFRGAGRGRTIRAAIGPEDDDPSARSGRGGGGRGRAAEKAGAEGSRVDAPVRGDGAGPRRDRGDLPAGPDGGGADAATAHELGRQRRVRRRARGAGCPRVGGDGRAASDSRRRPVGAGSGVRRRGRPALRLHLYGGGVARRGGGVGRRGRGAGRRAGQRYAGSGGAVEGHVAQHSNVLVVLAGGDEELVAKVERAVEGIP